MKKAIKLCLILILTAVLLIQPAFAAASFPDTSGHWAEAHIDYLFTQGLINGYPDGTFRPNNTISRAEVAAILANELSLPLQNSSFPDVPGTHWATGYIGAVVNASIMSGYPDGTFKPNTPMTRAEIASVLASAYNLTASFSQSPFSDVTSSHWAFASIVALADNDVTTGYPDGTYRPA
ncbi:MAG: S-layer homology domain-containing protein, partial [Erysipelotrichaceae bacterium]|nr:S-layer homology domain-containing protein [Erysipelotrichaceae bacterium]